MQEIRDRVASGPSTFHVIVPFAPIAVRPGLASMGDTGLTSAAYAGQLDRASDGAAIRAERTAEARLRELLVQIRALGSEAQGEVGVSRWLRMDVPNRVKRKFKVPVTTVTAKQ